MGRAARRTLAVPRRSSPPRPAQAQQLTDKMAVRDLASRAHRLIRQPASGATTATTSSSVVHISDAIKSGLDKSTYVVLNGPNLNMLVRREWSCDSTHAAGHTEA